jgi:two-component system, OmpR family, sensor kinase
MTSSANPPAASRRTPGLFWRLMAAFFVLVLTVALLVALLTRRATRAEFALFTSAAGQQQAALLAPDLAEHYRTTGSWDGVEALLELTPLGRTQGAGRGQHMQGRGAGQAASGMAAMMGLRVLVIDNTSTIVADSQAGLGSSLVGEHLSPQDHDRAVPILVGDSEVGAVLVAAGAQALAPASTRFLNAVDRATLLAVVAASLLALLLGAFFTWRLTRPLQQLTAAADAIAAGDLAQRVAIAPGDEIGDLAAAFNQMAGRLDRSEELRKQMTADIAHELRTPLSVIQGNVEALQDGVFPLTAEALAPIRDRTALLIRLVEDLGELTRAETEHLSLERTSLDLAALVNGAVADFQARARERDISLTAQAAPGLPPVFADAQRTEQVIANLLSNALRHTPPGGAITVEVAPPTAIPGFTPHPGQPEVAVVIADTGPGIPPEELPNIFERFYRADRGRSRDDGGSGLGLAIARSLIAAHNGRTGAYNRPQGGAAVWFTLPVAPLSQ